MASLDRLAELRGERKGEGPEAAPLFDVELSAPSSSVSTHVSRYTTLHTHIAALAALTAQFDDLSASEKAAASVKKRRDVGAALQKTMDNASALMKRGKKELDDAERENAGYIKEHGAEAATSQIRTNLHQKAKLDFSAAVRSYHTALSAIQSDLRARSAREVKLVDPLIDEAKVEQLVDSGNAGRYVQAKLLDEPSEQLKSTVSSIESRFLEIRALERSVLEIAELFRDMDVLVNLQQESLDVVERHIVKAKDHADKGHDAIQQASKWQDKARKYRFCLCLILLVVLAIILVPTISKSKGLF